MTAGILREESLEILREYFGKHQRDDKGGIIVPTSSILHNIVISDPKKAEALANALRHPARTRNVSPLNQQFQY